MIPFARPWIPRMSLDEVDRAMHSGEVGRIGHASNQCVEWLREYTGRKYVLLANSGTMALQMALAARTWRTVQVPDYTFAATANAVLAVGKKLELVDAPTSRNCIHVPMHGRYEQVPSDAGLVDAAQCFHVLNRLPKRPDLCGSFFVNKPLTAGEGGFFATNSPVRFGWAKAYQDHGRLNGAYTHAIVGANGHLPNLNAALLLGQLKQFNLWIQDDARQQWAAPGLTHAGWCWIRRCATKKEQGAVLRKAKRMRIDARPDFPPLRTMPAFRGVATRGGAVPSRDVLLPKWYEMPNELLKQLESL